MRISRSCFVVAGAGVLAATAQPLHAQPFSDAARSVSNYSGGNIAPSEECERLADLELAELVEITTRMIPAAGTVPAHCRVNGVLEPEVAFEVNLPLTWNGRFYMIGNGGLAGQGPDDLRRAAERAAALEHGFAIASTNTGHDASEEPGGTFVLSNPQKALDYAYRAVHVSAVAAKEIAHRFYGQPVAYAYWNSCSNGGRQGLIEAQRYPHDFDGIVAAAPWVDQTGFVLGAIWNQQALDRAPISAENIALVANRVMAVCDAVDGLADGIIDDPRNCAFEVARDVPLCPAGVDGNDCLTEAQATTIQQIYDGPSSNGEPLFAGFMLGSEALVPGPNGMLASGWANLILPAQPGAKPADLNLAESLLRYLALDPPQPDYDYREFDFDRDAALLERWAAIGNATDTDLRAFRDRGGKLIMTYGWSDAILQPLMGVEYYEAAAAANGPSAGEFLRLFMAPGMAHCGGGLGPDQHDAVTAVIDWVETGAAPNALLAQKIVDGEVVRSRPLCPYPQVARYAGEGSIDEAASFACAE
jgi:hypothetical protein